MSRFTYKGVDLSPFLKILRIERTIGNERNIATNAAPKIGVNVQEVTFGAKTIKVKVSLASRDLTAQGFVDTIEYPTVTDVNLNNIREQVTALLHAESEYRLELPDEPDRYYMAIPKGDIELDGISDWYDETTIEFFVPDGVAHSTVYRQFDTPTVSSDRLTFNLVNNGNVDAFPIITIRNNAENGYVGLVNTSGAMELGNREEADTEVVRQSELLFDYRDGRITTGLRAATKNVAVLNDTTQTLRGTIGNVNWQGRDHLFLQNPGGTTGYNAGSLTWNIPADSSGATGSLNDYIWWRQVFWLGAANQFGFIKLTVSDEQGRFLYGVETYKRSNGLGCEYNFMASDGKGGYNMIKQWTFVGTHENHQNPFNEPRGWSDLKRNDDQVTVFWWGSYNTFTIPEIKGRKSAKVHVALGAIGNKPVVARMYLDSIFYRKDFVAVAKDIPNRYPIGSTIVVDSEDDTVMVDGLDRFGDRVQGSAWLKIPPGNSQLEVYSSSWARTKPTVTVKFEERYL